MTKTEVLLKKGKTQATMGKIDEALESFDEAIKLGSNEARCLYAKTLMDLTDDID